MNPNTMNKQIKRLFWDIETSPNVVLAWRAGYDISIDHDNIIKERKIITIAYKWEGCRKIETLTWDKDQDDTAMLEAFVKVAGEADEMVAHYGDRFDLPWFKTRCLMLGLPPLPAYKTIDTKAWASKNFYFNSNKLDYLGKVLGCGGKIQTSYGLWKDIVLHRCPKALKKMAKYNARDVELLEQVYKKLALYIKPKSHTGVLNGLEKWTCPRTGSTNVVKSKTFISVGGTKRHQMKNMDNGTYYTIGEPAYKAFKAQRKHPAGKK